ncbi:MAG: hypothetical protein QOJ39_2643, partial [Candidatus Eremiobacteraeota bacterium]|jgi:hypothetical protein|nr:hypothetical protein [Candidatus Eremiobacteraeota bacterium]
VPRSSASKDVHIYVPAPPASARKSPEAFKGAAAKTIAAENVRGRFHVARDGVSRVYEQHVDFVLPGWKMNGHVTGFIVGPNDRITILADFAHGDTLVRHHEAGTRATSSLEIDS